tara:strand:+ start:310 stop:1563 length:1254 start_codon:yes stop_codon:yes gene_type:complete
METNITFINKIINFIKKLFTQENRFILWELVVFYSIVLILFRWNPMDISTNYPVACYLFLLFIFFISIIYFLYLKRYYFKYSDLTSFLFNDQYQERAAPNLGKLFKNFSTFVVTILTILAFVIAIIYIIKNIPSAGAFISFLISSMILIGIIFGALFLIKGYFKNKDNKDNKIFKKINEILEKITNIYVNYIKPTVTNEKKLIKEDKFMPFWNIFIVEFILITSYFAIPHLFKLIMSHDGIKLLERPIYLNNEQQFPEGDDTLHTKFSDNNIHNYHYSISAWFNLNPQPPNMSKKNNKYTNILNYGNKPKISFNIATNSLRIETEIKNKELTEIYLSKNIPYQRWNNIVVNYDGGYMDVFLNGNLVSSKSNIVPLMSYEKITIGEAGGLEGGIKNVTFFNRILTKGEIKYSYDIYSK